MTFTEDEKLKIGKVLLHWLGTDCQASINDVIYEIERLLPAPLGAPAEL